ncbi:hypothetical protein D3C74_184310 [compost metagenome]
MLDGQEYDFAFSFAGKERECVEQIYTKLKDQNYCVFFDDAYQAQLVGKDLYTGLRDVYKNKGKYVVCFISESYTKGIWTNLEFTAIKERLLSTFFAGNFLIPILIGNTQMLEDIPSYIGFYRHESVDKTVQMLLDKFNTSTIEDNFMSNINNFISYLCEHIYKALQSQKIETSFSNNNELSITKHLKQLSLIFTPDPFGQAPCVLVKKYDLHHRRKATVDVFPTFIITWKKQKNIYFSIHEFDANTENSLIDISFHEVLEYIHTFIQDCLGG